MAGQIARVNGNGDQRLQHLGMNQGAFGQLRQQTGWQVVDAVVAAVLKNVEGGTFT
ncbi:hypothetical protein D9M73_222530 [compost metagenome]